MRYLAHCFVVSYKDTFIEWHDAQPSISYHFPFLLLPCFIACGAFYFMYKIRSVQPDRFTSFVNRSIQLRNFIQFTVHKYLYRYLVNQNLVPRSFITLEFLKSRDNQTIRFLSCRIIKSTCVYIKLYLVYLCNINYIQFIMQYFFRNYFMCSGGHKTFAC